MSTHIKYVQMDKTAVAVRLATTGVNACIAVVIWPEDGSSFVYHIDPLTFNVESEEPREECLKLIKIILTRFRKRKGNAPFNAVFIIGGLKNRKYERLHKAFHLLATSLSALGDRAAEPIDDDVRAFCQSIRCLNLVMNVDGESDGKEATAATFITDLTVLSDRTSSPPTLCVAQYFGTDGELTGDVRAVRPWLIFTYDVSANTWCVADLHPRDHQQSSLVPLILADFDRLLPKNSSTDADLVRQAEQIINLLAIITD